MRLFLIRHGETVDNVAGVYAGSRDSELTNHGFLQARHLGQHLANTRPKVSHIFCSQLKRAVKTATSIQEAQTSIVGSDNVPIVTQVQEIAEQDFGFYEGKSFYPRVNDSNETGRAIHYESHKDEPGFKDIESKDSLDARSDVFLDKHLVPLLDYDGSPDELTVVVVSHGILLSHLWRRLLVRLPRKSLTIMPEVTAMRDQLVLEHLGGWHNTGFLELSIRHCLLEFTPLPGVRHTATALDTSEAPARMQASPSEEVQQKAPSNILEGYAIVIMTVNGQEHLRSLKRTRGGIGSAAHDEGQKTINTFFKRAKKS